MEETVQVLLDEGALVRNGSMTRLTRPLGELKIPPTVQANPRRAHRPAMPRSRQGLAADAGGHRQGVSALADSRGRPEIRTTNLSRCSTTCSWASSSTSSLRSGDIEYTFKHALTQEVAYNSVLNERRKELHDESAAAIEALYADSSTITTPSSPITMAAAANAAKAVEYLGLVGEQALQRSAYAEALAHLTSGLELLRDSPPESGPRLTRMQLQLELGEASRAMYGPASDQAEAAWSRAYELCLRDGESLDLLRALAGIRVVHRTRGAVRKSCELARESLEIARRINDPTQLALTQSALGGYTSILGDLPQARQMLEESIELFRSLPDVPYLQVSRLSLPDTLDTLGRTLWLLGFPDEALKQLREVEIIGHRSSNPVVKAFAIHLNEVHFWCSNFAVIRENAQRLLEAPWVAEITPIFPAQADLARGWLLAKEGQPHGIAMIRDAMARMASARFALFRPMFGSMLAEACASVGRIDEALSAVDKVLPIAQTEDRYYEAELNRLRGEFLLMQDASNAAQAEQLFHTAIEIARRQNAKSWELRATHEPRAIARQTGQARRGARDARRNLQLVHRRLRHRRSEGRKGAARRTSAK